MSIRLTDILMNRVVGDVPGRGSTVPLGIQILIVVGHTRQEPSARLYVLFVRNSSRGQGGAISRVEVARSPQCIQKRNHDRRIRIDRGRLALNYGWTAALLRTSAGTE